MKYDTAGNEVFEYSKCPVNCQSSAGCSVCRPSSMKTIQEQVAELKALHLLEGECAECGGTGEGADNPCSDRGETYPCYVCNGTGTWKVYKAKDVEATLTDIEAECAKEKETALTNQKNEIREKVEKIKDNIFDNGEFGAGQITTCDDILALLTDKEV